MTRPLHSIFRIAAMALLLALSACASQAETQTQRPAPAARVDPRQLVAILIAGDDSEAVFDHAIDYLADSLAEAGVPQQQIRRLSARPRAGVALATAPAILDAIAGARPPPGGSCFVFLTTHGVHGRGAYLSAEHAVLSPTALDKALTAGCGALPAVVVVSSCYSGVYAAPPVARERRIVITAAARDRSSFGCAPGYSFTYFDECLLGALASVSRWPDAFLAADACVGVRERHEDLEPSRPRAAVGALVAGLPTPWSGLARGGIVFAPGSHRVETAATLMAVALDRPDRPSLPRYSAARAPKAMAIAPIGIAAFAQQNAAGSRDADDVARIALQRCEWVSGGGCMLLARDNTVIRPMPSGLPPFHPEMLRRTGILSPADLPFVDHGFRGRIDSYLAAPAPKALAVSPTRGVLDFASARSRSDARAQALAACRRDAGDCVIYADGDRIVLGW